MSSEHYFTGSPSGDVMYRRISTRLEGRQFELTTANGVFSPARLDSGTEVLLAHVPDPPSRGNLLDVGCGWGPIALSLALRSPNATVWAVDSNERARALTAMNAKEIGATNVRVVAPAQVPSDVVFDAVWSNPPIRVGKAALHDLLIAWLPRLRSGSDAWLVVQRNLGSDSLHRWLTETLTDFHVERAATSKGFRLLRVSRNGSRTGGTENGTWTDGTENTIRSDGAETGPGWTAQKAKPSGRRRS